MSNSEWSKQLITKVDEALMLFFFKTVWEFNMVPLSFPVLVLPPSFDSKWKVLLEVEVEAYRVRNEQFFVFKYEVTSEVTYL